MKDCLKIMKGMEPYVARHEDIPSHLQKNARKLLKEYDSLDEDDNRRTEILKNLFGNYHPLTFIGSNFKCDYGVNIHFNGLAVINHNVVMLDTSPVIIGAGAFIWPGTCFACAGHSIDPVERTTGIST